jgi:hypothetical protein
LPGLVWWPTGIAGRSQVSEPKLQDKPFRIAKQAVWEAYRRVKANKGAAGVDEQSIAQFDVDRDRYLYRIWNRMSSGSYFPPPVKAVEIPKAGGKGIQGARGAYGGGPDRPDGGEDVFGAEGRTGLPSRLLRLPAGQVCVGRGGGLPSAVLAD